MISVTSTIVWGLPYSITYGFLLSVLGDSGEEKRNGRPQLGTAVSKIITQLLPKKLLCLLLRHSR